MIFKGKQLTYIQQLWGACKENNLWLKAVLVKLSLKGDSSIVKHNDTNIRHPCDDINFIRQNNEYGDINRSITRQSLDELIYRLPFYAESHHYVLGTVDSVIDCS